MDRMKNQNRFFVIRCDDVTVGLTLASITTKYSIDFIVIKFTVKSTIIY